MWNEPGKKLVQNIKTEQNMAHKLVLESIKTPSPKTEIPNMVLLASLPSLVRGPLYIEGD